MKYEKNRKVFGMDELQFMKLLRFLILPAIAVVLVVVILIADMQGRKKNAQETAVAETTAENITQEETTPAYDYANADPQHCDNDEVNELVNRYLAARAEGDADTIADIFQITDETELEDLKTQLDAEKKLYDSFENTVNYTIPGVEEDSWIVYINTQGWFKKIETPAPMLFRAYAVRGDDGELHFKEDSELTGEEAAAVKAADSSEKVREMNTSQRTELAKAIVSDAKLGSLYERLKVGGTEPAAAEPTSEAETVTEAVVEIGGTETSGAEDAGSTAGETESAAESGTGESAGSAAGETETAAEEETGESTGDTETGTETAAENGTGESAGSTAEETESAAEGETGTAAAETQSQ